MRRFVPILLLVILACAGLAYAFWPDKDVAQENSASRQVTENAPLQFQPPRPPRGAPAGQKEYYDAAYRFSLFYPDDLIASAHAEGGGATTIIFEDRDAERGFQIFVVPYRDMQISEERFRKDLPSGVRENLQEITIDGATGASFFSRDAVLGETAEIWFVHNGYLFEVTTLKTLAPWLSEIMRTWAFI